MEQNLVEEREAQRSTPGLWGWGQDQLVNPRGQPELRALGYLEVSVKHTSEVPWSEGRGISEVYPSSPHPPGATKKPERESRLEHV